MTYIGVRFGPMGSDWVISHTPRPRANIFCYNSPYRRKVYSRYLYIKVPILRFWPARDWSKPPSVNRQRHIRGRRLNDDVVLRCCLLFIILHHRRSFSDGRTVKWYFGNISHKQIKLIALSLFTRRRRVARSANYPGRGPGARSLQWNAMRRAAGQSSVYRVLFILQIALPTSLLTDN